MHGLVQNANQSFRPLLLLENALRDAWQAWGGGGRVACGHSFGERDQQIGLVDLVSF